MCIRDRRYVDRMLVIFPFEEPFYRERGVQAEFVGHPLAELPQPSISREQFALESGLEPDRTWIGLLPGSRPKEIRDNLPEMLEAAWNLTDLEPVSYTHLDVYKRQSHHFAISGWSKPAISLTSQLSDRVNDKVFAWYLSLIHIFF